MTCRSKPITPRSNSRPIRNLKFLTPGTSDVIPAASSSLEIFLPFSIVSLTIFLFEFWPRLSPSNSTKICLQYQNDFGVQFSFKRVGFYSALSWLKYCWFPDRRMLLRWTDCLKKKKKRERESIQINRGCSQTFWRPTLLLLLTMKLVFKTSLNNHCRIAWILLKTACTFEQHWSSRILQHEQFRSFFDSFVFRHAKNGHAQLSELRANTILCF